MSTRSVYRLGQTNPLIAAPMGTDTNALSKQTIALDSAYSYGVSGDCFAFTFVPEVSGNLTDLWLAVESYAGTWGSTDGVVNVQVREDLNGTRIPGTTLVSAFTVTLPGSGSGWLKKSGLSIALTAGRLYTIVVGDADGGATNYVTLNHANPINREGPLSLVFTSTAGFSAAGSVSYAPCVAMRIGSLMYGGALYSAISTDTSGTFKRGNVLTPGDPVTIVGVNLGDNPSIHLQAGATVSLFLAATAPGGAALKTWTIPASTFTGANDMPRHVLFAEADWFDLSADVEYCFVIAPGSATTVPRYLIAIAGADSDLRSLRPWGMHYVYESGGAWVEDEDRLSAVVPLVAPRSGGLIVHAGLSGGFGG